MDLNFDELVLGLGGEVLIKGSNTNFNNICTDTRKIEKNNVFLALKGEKFNGNLYAKDALLKGASIVVVDENIENLSECEALGTVIKVKNSYDSLLSLAKYYREKLNIKVVGITGSTGKTSTKDLTAAFLSGKYKVFKTKGNFNNHIGLPLMILELDKTYDVAVLELGMSHFNEIHTLANAARPNVAIITNIGLSHIENLKTQENILKAKMEITDFFTKDNILIVNGEDKFLRNVTSTAYKVRKTSLSEKLDIKAENVQLFQDKTTFDIVYDNKKYTFNLPMVGAHNVLNAMLAIQASIELGATFEEMINGLSNMEATSMRLQFIKKDNFTIINDCYNASPDSMEAALNVLSSAEGKRKVAILGTMNELGEESENAHKAVGKMAKEKVDLLIVTGIYKDQYKNGFEKGNIRIYNTKEDIINDLKNIVNSGDTILVKASRSIKYEDIVKALEKM